MRGRALRSSRIGAAGLAALRDRAGATAIEYGLICALVFLAFAGSVRYFANSTNGLYDRIMTNMR